MNELVSIIMPCFNAAQHLPRSFASVLDQTYPNLELIAVDDGSSDGTLAWLQAQTDSRVRVLSQPNRGVSAARNAGLRLTRGQYVAFLDSDDTWSPEFIKRMLFALEQNKGAAIAYSGWQNLGVAGGRGEPFIPPDYEVPDKQAALLVGNRWPIHAALTRKERVIEARGFDESLAIAEDYLLWLEIASYHPIIRVPEAIAFYHHHSGVQATNNTIRAAKQTLEAKTKFLVRHPDMAANIGRNRIRKLLYGELLAQGYQFYWQRDIETARAIFRRVMRAGYGSISDWTYMLPSLLPVSIHRKLLKIFSKIKRNPNIASS